jgi:methionine-rich copper-binding protein CopC
MKLHASSIAFVAACACCACSGNGVGLDQNGRPLTGGTTQGSAPSGSFQSIQDDVFTPICTACHAGANAPLGLRLDAGNSYALLVGVPSAESPSTLRVKPGDPSNSYLVMKIEGSASVGARMPLGGPPLPASAIAEIKQWITDGALQSSAPPAGKTLQITTSAPAANDVVQAPLGQIIVSFDGALDAALVDSNSVQLQRVMDGNVMQLVAAQMKIAMNPQTLIVTPTAALAAGNYRLVLGTASGTTIADVNARAMAQPSSIEFSVTSTP